MYRAEIQIFCCRPTLLLEDCTLLALQTGKFFPCVNVRHLLCCEPRGNIPGTQKERQMRKNTVQGCSISHCCGSGEKGVNPKNRNYRVSV